ncbi:hypothetical protein OGATHE_001118 [Ogataea polymorpha]|uniref:Uncharacterized protein n=1 Tax=Ogataea polymorpha TaxID=460523 RepID=A0A9P8PSH9_9ASCO|nr:hypothetical protein OGATHE_001118 [Ogataea polymorpha]
MNGFPVTPMAARVRQLSRHLNRTPKRSNFPDLRSVGNVDKYDPNFVKLSLCNAPISVSNCFELSTFSTSGGSRPIFKNSCTFLMPMDLTTRYKFSSLVVINIPQLKIFRVRLWLNLVSVPHCHCKLQIIKDIVQIIILNRKRPAFNVDVRNSRPKVLVKYRYVNGGRHEHHLEFWIHFEDFLQDDQKKVSVDRTLVHLVNKDVAQVFEDRIACVLVANNSLDHSQENSRCDKCDSSIFACFIFSSDYVSDLAATCADTFLGYPICEPNG